MTFTVKVLLTIALILSIAVPFGAFAAGERSRGRYKRALGSQCIPFLRHHGLRLLPVLHRKRLCR